MGFKTPAYAALKALASELDQYQGNNPQRHSFIALYKHLLASGASEKILTALAIFEYQKILSEYSYLSPERSAVFRMLKTTLQITPQNALPDHEILYYVNKLKTYTEKNQTLFDTSIAYVNSKVKKSVWKKTDDLKKHIHTELKHVRRRDKNRIYQLMHATPELEALRKGRKNLPARYRKARLERWSWFQNVNREPTLHLIDLLDEYLTRTYSMQTEKVIPRLHALESDATKGLILFLLMDVYRTYRIFSPKGGLFNAGSELFKEGLPLLNVKYLSELSYDDKINWLKTLADHIDDILKDEEFCQAKSEEWQKKQFKQGLKQALEHFKSEIIKFKDEQEKEKQTPTYTSWAISTLANYAAQAGILTVSKYVAEKAALHYLGATSLMALELGTAAVAVYIGGTLIFVSGLYKLVTSGLLSTAAAAVQLRLLDMLGNKVGEKAADVYTHHFSTQKGSIEALRRKLSDEDDKVFRRWINTLLVLPSDIVSEEEKQQLRNVFGLEIGEKLLPLPSLKATEDLMGARLFANNSKAVIEDYTASPENEKGPDLRENELLQARM